MKILTDVFPVIIAAIFGSERCGPDVEKAIGVGTKYLTVYHNMKNTMFLDPRDCFYLIRTNRTSAEYSNVEIGNFFADALYKTETRMRITSFKRDGPRDRIDILDPGASDARDDMQGTVQLLYSSGQDCLIFSHTLPVNQVPQGGESKKRDVRCELLVKESLRDNAPRDCVENFCALCRPPEMIPVNTTSCRNASNAKRS
ncbi:uncharacterized protein LOC144176041 isoform X1 [Haemaphysalis longicornis]